MNEDVCNSSGPYALRAESFPDISQMSRDMPSSSVSTYLENIEATLLEE